MSDKTKQAENKPATDCPVAPPPKVLTAAAQRALAEAAERRRLRDAEARSAPREINGRGGLDPARYGDWEVKGIVSDF
jgi:hypothetical protein